MRITPIKGVTETIFEVNLGKNSFANTAKIKQELKSNNTFPNVKKE